MWEVGRRFAIKAFTIRAALRCDRMLTHFPKTYLAVQSAIILAWWSMLALLPATAAIIGAVMLRQVPTWPELVGLVLVSGAIAMTARGAPR